MVRDCNNVTNDTVVAILADCQSLIKVMIMSKNMKITDEFKAQCDQLAARKRYTGLRLEYWTSYLGAVGSI